MIETIIQEDKINFNKLVNCYTVTILTKHLMDFIININVLSITLLFSRFIGVVETFIHKAYIYLNRLGNCLSVTILTKHLMKFILKANSLSIALLFSRLIDKVKTLYTKPRYTSTYMESVKVLPY